MYTPPMSVRVSIQLFRVLLLVYPRPFRRQFRSEMMRLFEDMSREAVEERTGVALFRMWLGILLDTIRAASRERFHQAKHILLDERLVAVSHWRAAVVFSLTAAMLVTPADPASMIVLGLPLFGVYICTALASRLPRLLKVVCISLGAMPLAYLFVAITRFHNTVTFIGDNRNWYFVTFIVWLPLGLTALVIVAVSLASRLWSCKCPLESAPDS